MSDNAAQSASSSSGAPEHSTQKPGNIVLLLLRGANGFLFVVTPLWQHFHSKNTSMFEGPETFRWIYGVFQVIFWIAHLFMCCFSCQFLLYTANISGSVGFELILWTVCSLKVWGLINVGMVVFATLYIAHPAVLDVLTKVICPLGDDPSLEAHSGGIELAEIITST